MTPEKVWRGRRDEELLDAASRLHDYYEDGQWAILSEMARRGLLMPNGEAPQVPERPQPVVSAVATANVPAGTTAPGGHPDAHGSLGLWPPGQAMTRVWRGEFSLAMTYWGFAQCGGLILAIPQLGLRVMGLNTAAQLVDGVAFAYSVVVIVGIWRSAGRYPGNPVWAHLARLATLMPLVVALLTMLGQGPGPGPG
ncbi:MAG: hypothetical protein ABL971_04665 [Vicinamibacterales bacterium]